MVVIQETLEHKVIQGLLVSLGQQGKGFLLEVHKVKY